MHHPRPSFVCVADAALTNITENKLADFEDNPEVLKTVSVEAGAVSSYNEEAEQFAIQHRVNKLKQHHRRAFELISRALKIDEDVGNKDGATVELYKKGGITFTILPRTFREFSLFRHHGAGERPCAGV